MNRKLFELYCEDNIPNVELDKPFCLGISCGDCTVIKDCFRLIESGNMELIHQKIFIYEDDINHIKENYPELLI